MAPPKKNPLKVPKKICSVTHPTKNGDLPEKNKGYLIAKKCLHLIMLGRTKGEIVDDLENEFDIYRGDAHKYYISAMAVIDERNRQNGENIIRINRQRLEGVIEECHDKGDLKGELQAIDLLNKMCGAYEQKININSDKPVFEIKIE